MSEKKVAECQVRASRKWEEENRERSRYLKKRSTARNFLKKDVTLEDMKEFQDIIEVRLEQLKLEEPTEES